MLLDRGCINLKLCLKEESSINFDCCTTTGINELLYRDFIPLSYVLWYQSSIFENIRSSKVYKGMVKYLRSESKWLL